MGIYSYRSLPRKYYMFSGVFDINFPKRANIKFIENGLIFYVKRSKNQYGEHTLQILVCRGGGILCLPSWLEFYFSDYFSQFFLWCGTCYSVCDIMKMDNAVSGHVSHCVFIGVSRGCNDMGFCSWVRFKPGV